jgi:phosphoserine phosphatase
LKSSVKMVVFDMDGVLVDNDSSWGCVHNAFKVGRNNNLSSYLAGEIDFKELMRRDIRRWGHIHMSTVERVLDKVRIVRGAKQAVAEIKKAGCYTVIISSGISVLADRVRKTLGIDRSLANRLVVDDNGVLTSEGEEVVPLLEKVSVFRRVASERQTRVQDCAVIGDSRYDIPLFVEAGLSIAFNSSDDQVKQKADFVIEGKDLRKVLPYILEEGR